MYYIILYDEEYIPNYSVYDINIIFNINLLYFCLFFSLSISLSLSLAHIHIYTHTHTHAHAQAHTHTHTRTNTPYIFTITITNHVIPLSYIISVRVSTL